MSRFLLVSLMIEAILREQKISDRREIKEVASALRGGYDRMLSQVRAQGEIKEKIGMAALMWVSHSERPLRVVELYHALTIEIGSADLDPENAPSIETLLNCCQGLLVVDKETSTFRLIHPTLQEYLSTCPNLFDRAHSTIAETCLTYLNFQRFKGLSASDPPNLIQTPFLRYSSMHWGTHAKKELSSCAKSLALKLFDDYDNHISVKLLLKHALNLDRFGDNENIPSFTGLHCASFFGIVEAVSALVEMEGCDVNQKDCVGNTPLIWATRNGHERAVELLLSRGDVDPNEPNTEGQTPLSWAAWNGHEGIVRLLLSQDGVDPNEPDVEGQVPLWWAARNGHEGIVTLLLSQSGVDPDMSDTEGQTPFWWAARNGHEGIMRLLLSRSIIDPDKSDTEGQTPFWWAARNGHEGIVRLLLSWGNVNPEKSAGGSQKPLWWAARNGHEGIVRLLLSQDSVDPSEPDVEGQTPLWWAARNGHEGIVRLLLSRDNVDPDKPDVEGQTPFRWASRNGHEGIAKLLYAIPGRYRP